VVLFVRMGTSACCDESDPLTRARAATRLAVAGRLAHATHSGQAGPLASSYHFRRAVGVGIQPSRLERCGVLPKILMLRMLPMAVHGAPLRCSPSHRLVARPPN
jgi:hypothetical protein